MMMEKTIDDDGSGQQRRQRRRPSSFIQCTIHLFIFSTLYSSKQFSTGRFFFCGQSKKLFRSNGPLKQFSATSDFVRCQRTRTRTHSKGKEKEIVKKVCVSVLMEDGEKVWNRCVCVCVYVEKRQKSKNEFSSMKNLLGLKGKTSERASKLADRQMNDRAKISANKQKQKQK